MNGCEFSSHPWFGWGRGGGDGLGGQRGPREPVEIGCELPKRAVVVCLQIIRGQLVSCGYNNLQDDRYSCVGSGCEVSADGWILGCGCEQLSEFIQGAYSNSIASVVFGLIRSTITLISASRSSITHSSGSG